MKNLFLALAVSALANMAHAAENISIDAKLTKNGRVVGSYEGILIDGDTGIYKNLRIVPVISVKTSTEKAKQSVESKPLSFGFIFKATPSALPGDKVSLKYSFSYAELVEMKKHEAQGMMIDLPTTTEVIERSQVALENGKAADIKVESQGATYILSIKATRSQPEMQTPRS